MIERNTTQESRTLELLKSRGLSWTPAPELAKISLQYCRVIACLRKKGYTIENRVERRSGVKHGFYRLIVPLSVSNREQPTAENSLFGDMAPDRSYRE